MLFLTLLLGANALKFQMGSAVASYMCSASVTACNADATCVAHDVGVDTCLLNNNYNQTALKTGILTKTVLDLYGQCSLLTNMITPITTPAGTNITQQPYIHTGYRNMLECSSFYNLGTVGSNVFFPAAAGHGLYGVPAGTGSVVSASQGLACWDAFTNCALDSVCLPSLLGHVAEAEAAGIPIIDLTTPYGLKLVNFAAMTKDQVCEYGDISNEDFKTGQYNLLEAALGSCFAVTHNFDIPYCMDKVVDKIKKAIMLVGVIGGVIGLVVGAGGFGTTYYCCCRKSKVVP